jgi:DNA-binding GntR family transcriptional regulator
VPLSSLPANAGPIERSDFVYTQLRAAILEGLLLPGERLVEGEVAAKFGVSRTPVHEAVLRLIGDGLVAQVASRGFIVAEFPAERIRQMLQARTGLMAFAARLAAQKATQRDVAELAETSRQLEAEEAAPTFESWREFAYRFNEILVRAAANPYLKELIDSIDTAVRIYRSSQVQARLDRHHIAQHHGAIAEALRAHDAESAERLTREIGLLTVAAWLGESE